MRRDTIGYLLFLVAIIFGFAVLQPKMNEVHAISVEKKARDTVLASKTKRLADLRALAPVFTTQQDRVSKIISTLPQDAQIPELLVALESMGQESGVTMSSLNPQISTKDKQVLVTVIGEGDLGAIEKIMQAISDNNRPMSVTAVSLARGAKNNTLSYNLTIAAPYVPGPVAKKGGL